MRTIKRTVAFEVPDDVDIAEFEARLDRALATWSAVQEYRYTRGSPWQNSPSGSFWGFQPHVHVSYLPFEMGEFEEIDLED